MKRFALARPSTPGRAVHSAWVLLLIASVLGLSACASGSVTSDTGDDDMASEDVENIYTIDAPTPDPRVGLKAGLFDAEEATWNMNVLSSTRPSEDFIGETNSDLAFTGDYAIQGNYNGIMVWDISNPSAPELVTEYVCPASQSDVSVYENLLFVSGEGLGGRVDCGTEGVETAVSADRLRGIRVFDISDIENPDYIANVQTCRGSHTHSILKDPQDDENVYVYVSGSAPVRPDDELAGCSDASPEEDPNTALFRIEVIKVPIDNPEAAAIVNSPRIFEGLTAAPEHGLSEADRVEIQQAREKGNFIVEIQGTPRILPEGQVTQLLNGMMQQRGGSGEPTAADSASAREYIRTVIEPQYAVSDEEGTQPGPTQCHDITLYPEIGRAGGACEGYGLLLDITDPTQPERIDAVADSNFSYWHSATFNNAGTKVLFTDEWGGGGQPKCRATDPMEWGANAIFSIEDGRRMDFESYYKLPAVQTEEENCVAHNGSLVPIPGRDVMAQAWYQGGISVFDWTDPERPVEIAFHDRGPVDPNQMQMGGSWSVYWYNGVLVSSEIARGLDIMELEPSRYLTKNELDAARTVELEYLNAQGQPKYDWPATFALARAYLDQLARSNGLAAGQIASARRQLADAERASRSDRRDMLMELAEELDDEAVSARDRDKAQTLAATVQDLATGRAR
jgi:hypothetical protein